MPTSPDRLEVLLATDLTARTDRAEARAVERARALGARLRVVAVQEPVAPAPANRIPREPAALAGTIRAQHGRDLDVEAVVDAGDAWPVILREAASQRCALIVMGPAQPSGLQERLIGSTAERVMHAADSPVLIVRRRCRGPYPRVLAATDFSACARHAVLAAAPVLPEADFLLTHAYRVPFQGFLSEAANKPEFEHDAERQMSVFAADLLEAEPSLRGRLVTHLLYGTPSEALTEFVEAEAIDLVVLGAHGAGRTFDKLLGGVAERLVGHLPCDVLVAREPTG